MGITKRFDFDMETKEVGKICKALGHPTRIQIMTLLWKRNDRTLGEFVELIPLAQSTISKHVLELKKAGLVALKKKGQEVFIRLNLKIYKYLKTI